MNGEVAAERPARWTTITIDNRRTVDWKVSVYERIEVTRGSSAKGIYACDGKADSLHYERQNCSATDAP